jgi:hypothetical protein
MGNTENSMNPETSPQMPPVRVPPDADPKGSKDPVELGNNGNAAQTAARPSAQEADANPAPLNEAHPVTKEA